MAFLENTSLFHEPRDSQTRGVPKRWIMAILGFFAFFCVALLRSSITVTLVAMVRSPPPNDTSGDDPLVTCPELVPVPGTNNSTAVPLEKQGEFDWDAPTQALILGAFYYGHVVTQIPGGILARKFGGKWLVAIGVLLPSLFAVLTPVAAHSDTWVLVATRVLSGLGEGAKIPAINAMIGQWAPKMERTRMSTIIFNGSALGNILSFVLSGYISATIGWPYVFYIFGCMGILWSIFWMALVHDTPAKHPTISKEELRLIKEGVDDQPRQESHIPWKSILTSIPVWIVILTHFGADWAFYTILTELPTYLSNVLHFNLKQNGFLSSLPSIAMFLAAILASLGADKIRSSERFRINLIRKFFNTLGMLLPALCMLLVGFLGCRTVPIISLLVLSMSGFGLTYAGFRSTHLDLSPEHAGLLLGLSSTIGSTAGFLAPAFVGFIVKNGQTVENWRIVFSTSSAVVFVFCLLFAVIGSAELQPWNSDVASRTPNPNKGGSAPQTKIATVSL